jgi:hypothetical protein
MARSRNIKPGFFQNELLAEIEPLGRLLFAGLWTIADRAGRLEDRPKRIKVAVLPYDDCDVDHLLSSLAERGFLLRYEASGEKFIQVLAFSKHQAPHCKEAGSIIPAPDLHHASTGQAPDLNENSTGAAPPDSLNLIPDSLNLIPENTPCSPSTSDAALDGFAEFWQAYPRKVAKPQAERAWKKLRAGAATVKAVMAGLELAKRSEQWQRDNGQYIPHPATWLNARRWEDEPEAATSPGELPDFMKGAL